MSENRSENPNLSPNQFFDNLSKSQILAPEKLEIVEKQLRRAGDKITTDKLVQSLIQANFITKWQSQKILKGRYKGFFLDKYKLLSHLGTGGMSTVYLAEQTLTNQRRAIKVLPRKNIGESSHLPRFYQEARVIAALNHPNIIRIYDANYENETHYMVMEYVQGSDLHRFVEDNGPLDLELACDCIVQAARGLAHAHDKGLIHRDIKPANLFRTDAGVVKVLDLGLALLKSQQEGGLSKQYDEKMMGTTDYLAPEQAINSHEVDHRADIYSLGCTLYFLLTGQAPFSEGTLAQRIALHQSVMPDDVSTLRPDCPESLNRICLKMMAKEPSLRFMDCRELITAIQAEETTVDWPPIITRSDTLDSSSSKTGAIESADASRKTSTIDRRTRMPWITIGILVVSAALPLGIGTYLWTASPNPVSENSQSTSVGKIESAADSQVRAEPVTSSDVAGQIDFDSSRRFWSSQKTWKLESLGIAGELRHDRHAKIVTTPLEFVEIFGEQVLRIRGDSQKFVFVPADRQRSRLQGVTFHAMRDSDSTAKISFESKSTKGSERWKEVVELTDRINSDTFNLITINDQELNKIGKPQKFRFTIEGNKENGLLVDHLKIELE